jgi:hypothetical protein
LREDSPVFSVRTMGASGGNFLHKKCVANMPYREGRRAAIIGTLEKF